MLRTEWHRVYFMAGMEFWVVDEGRVGQNFFIFTGAWRNYASRPQERTLRGIGTTR